MKMGVKKVICDGACKYCILKVILDNNLTSCDAEDEGIEVVKVV